MAKKYNLSHHLTRALALELSAEDILGGIGASDGVYVVAAGVGGSEADGARIQKIQEEIAAELRRRAAYIRARLA